MLSELFEVEIWLKKKKDESGIVRSFSYIIRETNNANYHLKGCTWIIHCLYGTLCYLSSTFIDIWADYKTVVTVEFLKNEKYIIQSKKHRDSKMTLCVKSLYTDYFNGNQVLRNDWIDNFSSLQIPQTFFLMISF